MKLNTEAITPDSRFWADVQVLAKEAFPPEEYLAPERLAAMAKADWFDFLALTEGEMFVGFMAVQTYQSLSYLFFLAIAPELRSKGYRSRAIRTLTARYPDKTQVVDLERVDEAAANAPQRLKRKAFYLRNGYRETGLFLSYLGVDYEVLCMGNTFCADEFRGLMENIPLEGFHPTFFCK